VIKRLIAIFGLVVSWPILRGNRSQSCAQFR
jgi:hypothetical protein